MDMQSKNSRPVSTGFSPTALVMCSMWTCWLLINILWAEREHITKSKKSFMWQRSVPVNIIISVNVVRGQRNLVSVLWCSRQRLMSSHWHAIAFLHSEAFMCFALFHIMFSYLCYFFPTCIIMTHVCVLWLSVLLCAFASLPPASCMFLLFCSCECFSYSYEPLFFSPFFFFFCLPSSLFLSVPFHQWKQNFPDEACKTSQRLVNHFNKSFTVL